MEAELEGGEHAFDDAVESDIGEARRIGFQAYTVVVVEDEGFLAVSVHELDAFAAEVDHEAVDEIHPVAVGAGGRIVRAVVASGVHEVL
jgi:hypothetical protein